MGKVKKAARAKEAGEAKREPAAQQAPPAAQPHVGELEHKERKPFSTVEVFTKPMLLATLCAGFRGQEVSARILRPRLMSESVEHGRGQALIRDFTFRKFAEVPHAVAFITTPRGLGGGSFEPTDRLLNPGEAIQVSYTMEVEGADRPIYFMGKGYFLRKSFYVADDPEKPGKPWIGSRDEATAKLPKNLVVGGDDVLEMRLDSVTSFPSGPGSVRRDILERYLSQARLYVLPGGAVWNQKSTQGHFFKAIRDPLDKFLQREGTKVIDAVTLDEFGNLGDITVVIKERLLGSIEHEVARPSVVKNPNDYLREINANIGFLLHFKMDNDVKEALMRTFPQKAGPEDDAYIPLLLERVTEARERYRVIFRVFPRDLVEERSRHSMERGLKFMPPYALHQGAENHITYSKLLIAVSQRFHEDEKPEDEKLKSEKLLASVHKRISEQQHKFVDEKVKSAFQDRVAAKKRKEEGEG